jgi:hypothetical protein
MGILWTGKDGNEKTGIWKRGSIRRRGVRTNSPYEEGYEVPGSFAKELVRMIYCRNAKEGNKDGRRGFGGVVMIKLEFLNRV